MPRSRRKRTKTTTLLLVVLGFVAVLALLRCGGRTVLPARSTPTQARQARSTVSPHLALGTPTDRDPSDDIILDERDFVLSFNAKLLDPNWVAWQLDSRYLGHVHRKDHFHADESLPPSVPRVTPHDYVHSGYDRGHLCPSADRAATEDMNSVTFLMTNMIPQFHEANAGPWERLEELERDLAAKPNAELYIVAGPLFDEHPSTIGRGVAVPRATYKIIVALAAGQTAKDVAPGAVVTSVIVPNDPSVAGHDWREFTTSVDDIERQSGYDFLSALADDVEASLEASVSRTL